MLAEISTSQSPEAAINTNHCWIAFKYTKLLLFRATPALKNSNRNMTVSIKAKDVLVQKSAFPKLLTSLILTPIIFLRLAHTKITEEMIAQVLMTQVAIKAFGPDKINFQIFYMIWNEMRHGSQIWFIMLYD